MNLASGDLENSLKVLPTSPGIYKFLDKDNAIIYIGKAKNLKRRVSSYFSRNSNNFKTKTLVRSIQGIEHVVVDSEKDALFPDVNKCLH